jgi:hypothetical protein
VPHLRRLYLRKLACHLYDTLDEDEVIGHLRIFGEVGHERWAVERDQPGFFQMATFNTVMSENPMNSVGCSRMSARSSNGGTSDRPQLPQR